MDKAQVFNSFNSEFDLIIKLKSINKYDLLKEKILVQLDGYYKFRLEKLENPFNIDMWHDNPKSIEAIEVDNVKVNQIKTILRDMYFKYNTKKKKTKENLEIEKLLKAKENNLDFDKELSEMICGDNENFPYRTSYYLTDFFNKLGYNFIHSNETRKTWVEDRLKEISIKDIHFILSNSNGLFGKKYFRKFVDENNSNCPHVEMEIDFNSYYKNAQKKFEDFIKDSIEEKEGFNLSSVLDLNVNIELLFDNEAKTTDDKLNSLIEEAKKRFLSNDKQVGLEKLWDAYERLKTYYYNDKKKASLEKVIEKISENFDTDLINDEFKMLTDIGNNYRIRHHETNRKELSNKHINYFFFRMLSLIDLYLMYYNEIEEEE